MSDDVFRRREDNWARETLKLQQTHLTRIENKLDDHTEKFTKLQLVVEGLKVRASIWGALSGALLSGLVAVMVWAVTR